MTRDEQAIEEEEERHKQNTILHIKENMRRMFELTQSEEKTMGISVDMANFDYNQQKKYNVTYSDRCYMVFVEDFSHHTKTWGYIKTVWENDKRCITLLNICEKNDIDDDVATELIMSGADVFFRSQAEIGFALKIQNDKPNSYYFKIPHIEYTNAYTTYVEWCD